MPGCTETILTIKDIINLLPHRYPMLLIDRVEKIIADESAIGIKNVTFNEPFFMGHFPDMPVMPGVLMIEAMAQTSAALVMHHLGVTHKDHNVFFMSISDVRFRHPVKPGDTLELKVYKQHQRNMVWKFEGKAFVKGKVMAEAFYTAMIAKK
jgi:3-hydroxyacyl-[acyl-carrier-protein] dehydratase